MPIKFLRALFLFNEATGDAPTGAGAGPATTTAVGTAPAAPAAAPPAGAPEKDPDWLNGRIAKAKKSAEAEILKQLGVTDFEAAKKAVAKAKETDEAEKSSAQRAVEAKAKADQAEAEAAKLRETIKEHAARQMVGLTEEQKKAVSDVAGDDPAAQLRAITALAPTWAKAEPTPVGGVAPVAKTPDTAPAPGAPKGTTASPTDPRAEYDSLKKTNPFAAARFGQQHPEVYDTKQ